MYIVFKSSCVLFRAHNLIIIFLAWLQVSDERDGLLVGGYYAHVFGRIGSEVKYTPSKYTFVRVKIFLRATRNPAYLADARI